MNIQNQDINIFARFSAFREWLKRKKRNAIILLAAAVLINAVALIYQFSGNFLATSTNARLAALFWAISVMLAGLSSWFFAHTFQEDRKGHQNFISGTPNRIPQSRSVNSIRHIVQNKTFLSLFPILVIAFILRVIPLMNHGLLLDEWYWLENAKFILKGVVVSPFGFIGDQPSNLPAYPLAILLLIVRNPLLAVRLIGVIYSLSAISLVYILLNKIIGFKAAICGSLLMAVSVWDIHMSALGWLNVNANPFLVVGVLLGLYQVWKHNFTPRTLFYLAFLVAISVHLLYVAALLVIPAFLVLAIHWSRNRNIKSLKEVVLFSLFIFICISPLIPKLIQFPESINRHNEFIQQNLTSSGESIAPLNYYWDQLILLCEDYFRGNFDFGHQGPWGITLDPLVRIFSILGILIIIIQVLRNKEDSFWLIVILTFCVQLLIPFVLLFRSSSAWRAYPILPIAYLFTIYCMVELSLLLDFVTAKIYINSKGLFSLFLTVIMILYFIGNFSWYRNFLNKYTKKEEMYENSICQTAARLIDEYIIRGSTIYMPDEMCFPLISILYDEDQFHFISVRLEDSSLNLASGDYVIIFNSWQYSGYYKGDIQMMIQQNISQLQTELVTPPYTSSPIIYMIR